MRYEHYVTVHSVLVLAAIFGAIFALFPPKRLSRISDTTWFRWSWLFFLLAVLLV